MYEDSNTKIDQIIEEGYDFKFGDYISRGFDIIQKKLGEFIGFSILASLIMIVVAFIPILGILADMLLLGPVFLAGFYIVANKISKGEQTEFGDFFKGFDFAGQIVLVTLISFIIGQIFSIPYYMANSELYSWYIEVFGAAMEDPANIAEFGDPPNPPSWTYLLALPSLYIWSCL